MSEIKQLDWSKLQPATPEKNSHGTKQFSTYQLKEMPRGSKHGAVKITRPSELPHPFKCSKCSYTASSKADFNKHWLEH